MKRHTFGALLASTFIVASSVLPALGGEPGTPGTHQGQEQQQQQQQSQQQQQQQHNHQELHNGAQSIIKESGNGYSNSSAGSENHIDVNTGATTTNTVVEGTQIGNQNKNQNGNVNKVDAAGQNTTTVNTVDNSEHKSEAFSRNSNLSDNLVQSGGTSNAYAFCVNGQVVILSDSIANGYSSTKGGIDLGFLGGLNLGRTTSGRIHKSQQEFVALAILQKAESSIARLSKFAGNPAANALLRMNLQRASTADIRAAGLTRKNIQQITVANNEADGIISELIAMKASGQSTDISGCTPQSGQQIVIKEVIKEVPVQEVIPTPTKANTTQTLFTPEAPVLPQNPPTKF